MNKDYEIHYLPLFQDDLMKTVYYISNILENPDAALKLVDDVEKVILKRSQNPLSFEPFRSKHKRKHSYYRIYIRNYVISNHFIKLESIIKLSIYDIMK